MEHKHRFHRRILDSLWRSATALPGHELSDRWLTAWALIWVAGFFVVMVFEGAEYWHYVAWSLGWLACAYIFENWRFNRWWRSIKEPGDGGRYVDFED